MRATKRLRMLAIPLLLSIILADLLLLREGKSESNSIEFYGISTRSATVDEIFLASGCLDQKDPYPCLTSLGATAVTNGQIGVFMDQLRYLTQENSQLLARCHNYLHEFGEQVADKVGPEALDLGYADCGYAFFHGALRVVARDLSFEELKESKERICAGFFEKDGVHSTSARECLHGLGHLLWQKAPNNDLPTTMNACVTKVGGPGLIEPCVIGANMELRVALTNNYKEQPSQWNTPGFQRILGSTDHTQALERYRQICAESEVIPIRTGCISGYLSLSFLVNKKDTQATFAICASLPEGIERSQCQEHTGAIVMENSNGLDTDHMARMCESFAPSAAACAQMVALQLFLLSTPTAIEFCKELSEEYQEVCTVSRAQAAEKQTTSNAGSNPTT